MLELEYSSERAQLLNSKDSLVHAFACSLESVSYTHLRAHETDSYLVCRLLLEKKKAVCSYVALWCKNQIKRSIWDESLLLSNCAYSLENSSLSTLVGLRYHICEKRGLFSKETVVLRRWGSDTQKFGLSTELIM